MEDKDLKLVLDSSLEEFLIVYSTTELAEILINNLNYKDVCTIINKINE